MLYRLVSPGGKVGCFDDGLVFDYAASWKYQKQVLIPWSRVTEFRLRNTSDGPGWVELQIDGDCWGAFETFYNSSKILADFQNPKGKSPFGDSGEEYVSELLGHLERVHKKASSKWRPVDLESSGQRTTFEYSGWELNITDRFVEILPLSFKFTNPAPAVIFPYSLIKSVSAMRSTVLKSASLLVFDLTDGSRVASEVKTKRVDEAMSLINQGIASFATTGPTPELVNISGGLLLILDFYRKKSSDYEEPELVQTTSSELATVSPGRVGTITETLKKDRKIWRRTKTSWKEISLRIEKLASAHSYLYSMDFAAQRDNENLFQLENCVLLETRKGVRVVTRQSQSSRSGGGIGGGVRIGGIGVGGGSYSGSSSSSSTTTYFPAPDELTEIESGQFIVRKDIMIFVGEQFNRQIVLSKLVHFAFDTENLLLQIVPPNKEKNFYIRFSRLSDLMAVRVLTEALVELANSSSAGADLDQVQSSFHEFRDEILSQEWSMIAFEAAEILTILNAAGSQHASDFEAWISNLPTG